ncbi:hypothetical protein T439DRAFT_322619 [Meredithblackwellia eburnea MCA 4105]
MPPKQPVASTSKESIVTEKMDEDEESPSTPLVQPSDLKKSQSSANGVKGDAAGKKPKRRLPACDSCKLRRVLCIPQPPPAACPRCLDKGIVCTTTPVIRRKPTGRTGKRIEEAKATFGTTDANAPHLTLPSNSPWIPTRLQPTIMARPSPLMPYVSSADLDTRLGLAQMSGDLAAHLLDLFQHVPQSWLPLIPRGKVVAQFEAVGRRLDALPAQAEVLAHTMIALTARLTSDPVIMGDGDPVPSFESLTPQYLATHKDLREFGKRREEMCRKLRDKAVRLAWERGTLVESCEESMACCHLLEMLEGRNNPKAGKPYGSAFVSHLRSLIDESEEAGESLIMNMPLGWSALIMREALFAANAGRTSHFAPADDLLLCGPIPSSIEETLLETVDDVDVRDSVTLFFRPMRPYTYHVARLARECSDRISGTHSRKQPLDERFVSKFLTQLDHLYQLLTILDGRISFVLSAAATSAHALPGEFETQRRYIMRACIHTLQLAWCSLSLPIYTDLKRRIEALKTGPQASMAERRRTRERLEILLQQVYRATIKAARMVAACVHGAPSLTFLTHLHQERLESWIEILLDAKTIEDGGEGITFAEKMSDLQWMLDGLKTMGWSWSDDHQLVDSLEASLSQLTLDAPPVDPNAPPPAPAMPQIDMAAFASSFSGITSLPTSIADLPSSIAGLASMAGLSSLPSSFAGLNATSGVDFGAMLANLSPHGGLPAFDLDALLADPLFGGPGSVGLDPSTLGGVPSTANQSSHSTGSGMNLDFLAGMMSSGSAVTPGGVHEAESTEGQGWGADI